MDISSDEDDYVNKSSQEIVEKDEDHAPKLNKLFRLGKCEVCLGNAVYTCPKCEVKTCSVNCSIIHKKELNCNGIRDKTKYIPLKNMTEVNFMSDYTFLEQCTRYVQNRQKDKIKKYTHYNKILPIYLLNLKEAAIQNKINLKFLTRNFSKHKNNTSRIDYKTKIIHWRIEWIFIQMENIKLISKSSIENEALGNLLNDCITENVTILNDLKYYQSKGLGNLKILLKSEGIPKCKNRFYELNCAKTLKENLSGKTIVEYPVIYVLYDDIVGFDIIDSDDDVENEAQQLYKKFRRNSNNEIFNQSNNQNDPIVKDILKTAEDLQKEVEEIEKDKDLEERFKKREEFKQKPKNFLVANESYYDDDDDYESSVNSEDTDEESNQIDCFDISDI